jgi:hypothetical protein
MSMTLQNKEGGLDVLNVNNMTEFVPENIAAMIKNEQNQFGDELYWSAKLSRYANHKTADTAGNDAFSLSLENLCLKVTGKPIGSFRIESAASKLFSLISDKPDDHKQEEHKDVPLLYDLNSQIMRHMVIGTPVTRVVEAARVHRNSIRASFGKHELRDPHATEKLVSSSAARPSNLSHAIVGDCFFTDEQNALSDQRTTWLRRIISLHRETTDYGTNDPEIKMRSDVVQKFWTNVILFSAEVFPQSKLEGQDMVIDTLLYRDLICVGLDLLISDYDPRKNLVESQNHPGKSTRESLCAKKLKLASDEQKLMSYSRSQPPKPRRMDQSGFYVYKNRSWDDDL